MRWNGKEQALHVLLDLAKIFKSAKVVAKKRLQLVFHNLIKKICLKIVLWLPTPSIHANLILSLRVGKNQEQINSTGSETLWIDSDDEVVQ